MASRYKYPECRSRMPGHLWDPYVGGRWVPNHGFGEEEMCELCGTIRRAIVSIYGQKSPWSYEYPFDYKTDIDNNELRLMVIKRRQRRIRAREKESSANVTPIGRRQLA